MVGLADRVCLRSNQTQNLTRDSDAQERMGHLGYVGVAVRPVQR